MNYKLIQNPSDIFSLIMDVYGSLEKSVAFVSDNSALIPSIDADISRMAGQRIYYAPVLVTAFLSPGPVLSNTALPLTQYSWMGMDGQNIFDVCLQTYGTLDKQVKLMIDNNVYFSTRAYLQQFKYDSTHILNSSLWNRTTGMGVIFSTGESVSGIDLPGGSFDLPSYDESFE